MGESIYHLLSSGFPDLADRTAFVYLIYAVVACILYWYVTGFCSTL